MSHFERSSSCDRDTHTRLWLPHRTYGYTQSAVPHNSRSTLLRRPDPAGRKCRAARRGRRTAADARGHASRCESIAPAAQYPISLTGGGARGSKLAGSTLCDRVPSHAPIAKTARHSRGHAPPPASLCSTRPAAERQRWRGCDTGPRGAARGGARARLGWSGGAQASSPERPRRRPIARRRSARPPVESDCSLRRGRINCGAQGGDAGRSALRTGAGVI